jgi:hypothetical protein
LGPVLSKARDISPAGHRSTQVLSGRNKESLPQSTDCTHDQNSAHSASLKMFI